MRTSKAITFGATLSLGVLLSACDMGQIVRATDPDIVLPEFVSNATGANALRLGALGRLNSMTTASESMFLYGGLFGDETTTGDTFTQRVETDQRSLTVTNANISDAYRGVHRARVDALRAREALEDFAPQSPAWQRAEMYFVEAYAINLLAEYFCNGQTLTYVIDGVEQYGSPVPNTELFAKALQLADSGAALVATTGTGTDDVRVRHSLAILRARIFTNQGNFASAATAATSVPTSFVWYMEHAQTARTPGQWSFINSQRRYIVSDNEGPLQMNWVSANDPRVPACNYNEAECTAAGWSSRRPFDSGNTAVPDMRYQLIWPTDASNVALKSGLQARLIEAEALNRNGNFAGALAILNTLRAAPPNYVVPGKTLPALAALTDPGTDAGRRDLIFRERGFWLYGLGFRYPDMRRMMRQYNMTQAQVFPSGTWQINRSPGYGTDVVFVMPQAEAQNPNVPRNANGEPTCIDENP